MFGVKYFELKRLVLEKLTCFNYGLLLFVGCVGFACSQGSQEPIEVGTTQIELREDVFSHEIPDPTTALSAAENSDETNPAAGPVPSIQRLALPRLNNLPDDQLYRAINRHELLSELTEETETRRHSIQKTKNDTSSGVYADKQDVRGGKGFGIGSQKWISSQIIQPDDEYHYVPVLEVNSYSRATEQAELEIRPFKNLKPLIFHSGATGFNHELPAKDKAFRHSPPFKTQLTFSPIPETRVSLFSKPKTEVILAPAGNRLDLMNGNEKINQDRFFKMR